MKNQQERATEGRYCSFHTTSFVVTGEDVVDFNAIPMITRLSTKAAHDKRGVAKNLKRRKPSTKQSLFLYTNEELKYGTAIVDPSAAIVSYAE